MSPSTFRRKIIVLVLGTALVASAAAAADLRSPAAFPGPLQLLSEGTQGLLERLASLLGTFWEKEGATIDPYGVPGDGQGQGKASCSLDPYGLCANGQSTGPQAASVPGAGETGPGLDPYGL